MRHDSLAYRAADLAAQQLVWGVWHRCPPPWAQRQQALRNASSYQAGRTRAEVDDNTAILRAMFKIAKGPTRDALAKVVRHAIKKQFEALAMVYAITDIDHRIEQH